MRVVIRWLLAIPVAGLTMLPISAGLSAAQAEDEKARLLFNGENLEGWVGDDQFWRVEDGMIVGETTEQTPADENTFLIWTENQPGDFELRFRYRITSDWGNSGLQFRSRRLHDDDDEGDYTVAGYQADIGTDDWITGIAYEEQGRGILARRGQKVVFGEDGSKQVTRFADEEDLGRHFDNHAWTEYRVVAEGDRIVTEINGHRMHEIIDAAPQASHEGLIAFQLHTGPPMTIQIKDVELIASASEGRG